MSRERQLTFGRTNHVLTNAAIWSHDGQWIYHDVRSDAAGSRFDGTRIGRVHMDSGTAEKLFRSQRGACVGVVTANPARDQIVFIHGPENPSSDWMYAAHHRRGVLVKPENGKATNLDARDLVPPYTPGALRGGTHLHMFSGDGQWVSFTYDDHVLASAEDTVGLSSNQRNIGIAAPIKSVAVSRDHPRNHDGDYFSVLVTQTTDRPTPGTDEIGRAYSDAWIGDGSESGQDPSPRSRAIAFIGDVVTEHGSIVPELFIVELPQNPCVPGDAPLSGTITTRPAPPAGTRQRRLTRTTQRRFPGLGDIRHWPRSSPDGHQIALLMRDNHGRTQLWWIGPHGGEPHQLTRSAESVQSAFTFRADGRAIACVIGTSVCEVDLSSGDVEILAATMPNQHPPRPEAVVYSPDGRHVAYTRPVPFEGSQPNQVFIASTTADR